MYSQVRVAMFLNGQKSIKISVAIRRSLILDLGISMKHLADEKKPNRSIENYHESVVRYFVVVVNHNSMK